MYLTCFGLFAVLQIPSALSPNIETLIAMRTLSGFFGSVGIANGGGSLSDMFEPGERAGVFGYYLLGPLMGPTLGPLVGGVIVQRLDWRWIFWVLTIVCTLVTLSAYFFLKETYAPALLARRKAELEQAENATNKYRFEGEDYRPLYIKLRYSLTRPLRILVQPIVLTMSTYQVSTTFLTFVVCSHLNNPPGHPLRNNLQHLHQHATNLRRRIWLQHRTSRTPLPRTWAGIPRLRMVHRPKN